MTRERIDSYRTEVNQWISNQGFLFQLFKAPKLVGSSVGALGYLVGVLFKVLAVLLLVGLAYVFYLSLAHTKSNYTGKIKNKIQESLAAESVVMKNAQGGLFSDIEVPEISIVGGAGSFFEEFRIQNAKCNLGNLISRKKVLRADVVTCSRLDTHVKISAGEGGESIFAPLFSKDDWFSLNALEAKIFHCKWGYSEKSSGSISGARLKLLRYDDAVDLEIVGGILNYAWLKEVNIESLKVTMSDDRFEITEGKFNKNGASFTLNLKADSFGVNPQLSGGGEIKDCKVSDIFRSEYSSLVTGVINSKFTLSGSPNLPSGLDFKFKPLVNEPGVGRNRDYTNAFKLRHSIPLWRALTTLDSAVNYRTFEFDDTNWEFELKGEEMYLREGRLSSKSDDRVRLDLEFVIKEPSERYIDSMVNVTEAELIGLLQSSTLKKKARELLKLKGDIGNFRANSSSNNLDREDYAKILRNERHFEGDGVLYLHKNSFLGKERLKAQFPVTDQGVRVVPIKLSGALEQVTAGSAQTLYDLGKQL